MPETTDRRWPTATERAADIRVLLEGPDGVDLPPPVYDLIERSLEKYYASGSDAIGRKVSRLTEMLKDSIEKEVFGPLFVDDAGVRIAPADLGGLPPEEVQGVNTTAAWDIWRAFRTIYTLSVLNSVNEEGELLP